LETTTNSMQSAMSERAAAEARDARHRGDLERQIQVLTQEKQRSDERAGARYVADAQIRHLHEELETERFRSRGFQDELQAKSLDVTNLREDSIRLGQLVDSLHAEAAQWRHAEGVTAAERPMLRSKLQREEAVSTTLRGRIAELEDVVCGFRRAHTALEAENSALRGSLTSAQAEVERCVKTSTRLTSERCGAEQKAKQQEAWRLEAERRLPTLDSECARLRAHCDSFRAEIVGLREHLQRMEADNSSLKSKLCGSEVMLNGLREEVAGLNLRLQRQQLQSAVGVA